MDNHFWYVTVAYDGEHEIEGCFLSIFFAKKFAKSLSKNYPDFVVAALSWEFQAAYTYLDGNVTSFLLS